MAALSVGFGNRDTRCTKQHLYAGGQNDEQVLAIKHFENYQRLYDVELGDKTLLLIEKFGIKDGQIVAAFTKGGETFQAFTTSPLKEGKVTYLEYTPCNRHGAPEHRAKEGFVHSGQIINVAAMVIFNTPSSVNRQIVTLNGTKLPAGSMEEHDTLDEKPLDIIQALCKTALREFAEETLGLAKEKGLSTDQLKKLIGKGLGAEHVIAEALVTVRADGSLERQPNPEFNSNIFCSPVVIIQLGTVQGEVLSKLKTEEGKTDIPKVCALSDLVSESSKFRNKQQLQFFVSHSEKV